MPDRPIEDLTLRELLIDGARLTRDLHDHVEQGFLPRFHRLSKLVSLDPKDPDFERTSDRTVRDQVSTVLDSDDFTQELYSKIVRYWTAIEARVDRIAAEKRV